MKSQQISTIFFLSFLTFYSTISPATLSPATNNDSQPVAEDFRTCLRSNSDIIFTPANSSFLPIWETADNNVTAGLNPSVIVTPVDENQVRVALSCAKKHGYEVKVRRGGHEYEGDLSYADDVPFVMVDLVNMGLVCEEDKDMAAWGEAGRFLGELYSAVSGKTGTLVPGDLCSSVGVGKVNRKHETDAEDFINCLQSKSNDISPLIFTPIHSSFTPILELALNNLRFNTPTTRKPSFIVTPISETQIRTTLLCTKKHGYEIRIRSGGHDFEGLSYTAHVPFVMLDLTNMRSVNVDIENRTAWVEGGALLGDLYYAISKKTKTLYFPGGFCPSVGVSGYISGGGYGSLIRRHGTAADNVVDVRFMDVNGNILDKKSLGGDLFWAIRGGGASSFGIVLSWKVKLVPVPETVTVFHVSKTLEEGATEIFHKYQYVFPDIDRDVMLRVTMKTENIPKTKNKTIRMAFDGLFLGPINTLLPLLNRNFPELNVTREACQEMQMHQSSMAFLGFPKSTSTEVLINGSSIIRLNSKSKIDYVRTPIPIPGLEKMFQKMFETDEFVTLFMQTFGGKNSEFSETEIPFPHRAGVLYQFHQQIDFFDQVSDSTPVSVKRISWLDSFSELVTPYVSSNPREAYVNYNDLDLGVGSDSYEEASVWGEKYFKKDNFKKLIRIKAEVDPENFFRHPQSIPVFSKSLVI